MLNIRRFSRRQFDVESNKFEYVPTTTVLVTVEGQEVPNTALLFKVLYHLQLYFPKIRQCLQCLQFGHVKNNCKGTRARCHRCGQNEHSPGELCPLASSQPVCCFCKLAHLATDKSCIKREEEQKMLDFGTVNNLTMAEVKQKVFEERRKIKFQFSNFPQLGEITEPTGDVLFPSEAWSARKPRTFSPRKQ